jgi:pimeloyl-ACP methyl ester carboxylesterase
MRGKVVQLIVALLAAVVWTHCQGKENVTMEQKPLESLLRERRFCPWLSDYFVKDASFVKTSSESRSGRSVVLVHGWGVREQAMNRLAVALAREGYDVYNYDYPSSRYGIAELAEQFRKAFQTLLHALPPEERLYVVTHSMGGLLLRGAMAESSEAECRRISAVVMLGPPNSGSKLAWFGKLPIVRKLNRSLGDMAPEEEAYGKSIPLPPWMPPIGIVAGQYDGKVAVKDTFLPAGIPFEHVVVKCSHPGLRRPKTTLPLILAFFRKLSFQ